MKKSKASRRFFDEPAMSDKTIVLDIEDLIALTFGPRESNVVNLTMMHTVLNILARQMRFLERDVEIKFAHDQERIEAYKQQLQEDALSSSSDSEEGGVEGGFDVKRDTSEKSIVVEESVGESQTYVETKPKELKRDDKKEVTATEVETAEVFRTPDEVADDSELKDKSQKLIERAISKTPDTIDDRLDIGEPTKADQKPKKEKKGKKERKKTEKSATTPITAESPITEKSEESEVKMTKEIKDSKRKKETKSKEIVKKDEAGKPEEEVITDDSSDVTSSDSAYSKETVEVTSKGKDIAKPIKQEMIDDSLISEEEEINEPKIKEKRSKVKKKIPPREVPIEDHLSVIDDVDEIGKDKKELKPERGKSSEESPAILETVPVAGKDIKKSKDSEVLKSKKRRTSGGPKQAPRQLGEVSAKNIKKDGDKTELESDKKPAAGSGKIIKPKGKKKKDKTIEVKPMKGKDATQSVAEAISVSEVVRKGGKGPKDTILVVEKGPTTRDSRPRLGNIHVVTRSQFELVKADVIGLMKRKPRPTPVPTVPDSQLKRDLAEGSATLPGAMQAMQLNVRVQAAEEGLRRMADLLTQLAADGTLPPNATSLVDDLQEEQRELTRVMSAKTHKELKEVRIKSKKVSVTELSSTPKPAETEKDVPTVGKTSRPSSTGTKPASQRPGARPTGRPGDKPAGRPGDKPAGRPGDKPAGRPGDKPKEKRTIPATKGRPSLVPPENPLVTRADLSAAVENMKHEMLKQMAALTAKSTESAEQAHTLARSVVGRLEIAMAVNGRIELLNKYTTEQSNQLSGFDTGLCDQLQKFQNKLNRMRKELKEGLEHLNRGDRIESSAVTSLRGKHDSIELQMDQTLHEHARLVLSHRQMYEDLKNMMDWMQLLRDEKAGREEVAIGLENKMNMNQLIGLLFEDAFEASRKELEKRLGECFTIFEKHNKKWLNVLGDLSFVSKDKADLVDLYSLKAEATDFLMEIKAVLEKVEVMMGDPRLAQLTRQLSLDSMCGSCLVPALMEPFEKSYGKPARMPNFLLDEPVHKEEPYDLPRPTDDRKHIVKRWVGGSHTLITSQQRAAAKIPQPEMQEMPIRHYAGAGIDGHTYLLEEELQGCVECKVLRDKASEQQPSGEIGSGDQGAEVADHDDQAVKQGPRQSTNIHYEYSVADGFIDK